MTGRASSYDDALDAGQRAMLAAVVERLALSTDDIHPVAELTALVVRCHADLAGSPPDAMPELVERLARERLGPRGTGRRPA